MGDGPPENMLKIRWCKGHATKKQIASGLITSQLAAANDHADAFAKQGAELDRHQRPNGVEKQAYQNARAWYKWLSVVVQNWGEKKDFDDDLAAQKKLEVEAKKREDAQKTRLHHTSPHRIWKIDGAWACSGCKRKAHSEQAAARLKKSACLPALREMSGETAEPSAGEAASRSGEPAEDESLRELSGEIEEPPASEAASGSGEPAEDERGAAERRRGNDERDGSAPTLACLWPRAVPPG